MEEKLKKIPKEIFHTPMKGLPIYLVMVSYQREEKALSVIENYLTSIKPCKELNFIVVENSETPRLSNFFNFHEHEDIIYHYFENKNKAAAVNFAIGNLIPEEEALIIHVDNDIRFASDFLLKYYQAALAKGRNFFFGGSVSVNIPKSFDPDLLPFIQGSARGKSDLEFIKMKRLMFLGCSYAFFKAQWKTVDGLDERFSPGSKYGLAADESVFQKRLVHAGYSPVFVERNCVEHFPVFESYDKNIVLKRQKNNGFTHGFQDLISTKFLLLKYFKKLFFLIRGTMIIFPKREKRFLFKMKTAYTKGYIKAFLLYIKTQDKKDFLEF